MANKNKTAVQLLQANVNGKKGPGLVVVLYRESGKRLMIRKSMIPSLCWGGTSWTRRKSKRTGTGFFRTKQLTRKKWGS